MSNRRKPPSIERKLILIGDHRRKYGARLCFQVQRPHFIGELENVTLMLPGGEIATISPSLAHGWEGGKRYNLDLVGFPKASDAESAGMQMAQALLFTAISLNFGLRLAYVSHEPPTVYDRTASTGMTVFGEMFSAWPQNAFLDEFYKAYGAVALDPRLLLSMELFAASALESNDRARFVMAVSALEPLAQQEKLGPEVDKAVEKLCGVLDTCDKINSDIRSSLKQRLGHLRRESVRQALKRLCSSWFEGNADAWRSLDHAYSLRSQLLHDGRPKDLDLLLDRETHIISAYLRTIYQFESGAQLKSKVFFETYT